MDVGGGWEAREKETSFEGRPRRGSQNLKKNWRGMMAPSPSTRQKHDGKGGGRVGGQREGWRRGRVTAGVVIRPPCSSFLQYVRVRAVRTIDEVLEMPSWGATHTCRGGGVRAREGGAFARSFQRIRRRDADALPRLRHLSEHATAGRNFPSFSRNQ